MNQLTELGLPIATVFALVICVWRFTSVGAAMIGTIGRSTERNEAQRDRFFQQMVEKMQVDDGKQAFQLAQLHAGETTATHRADLTRDAVADRRAKAKATAEEIHRNVRTVSDPRDQ